MGIVDKVKDTLWGAPDKGISGEPAPEELSVDNAYKTVSNISCVSSKIIGENMADIKTVVTTYGEYIGEIEEGADVIRLKHPRMVIQSQEGFGFAKGVCVTSVESPEEIILKKPQVVLVVDTHADVKKAYEEATSVIERV